MKRKRIAILSLAFLLAAGLAQAKSYRVETLSIQALVQPDGALSVKESLLYRFSGSFSFAFRDIPLKAGESIADIQVEENGVAYGQTDNGETGSYAVERGPEGVRVTWYYKAKNESRSFQLSYILSGVVKRYSDTAELYYQFVGDGWDHPIDHVRADVGFAESLPKGALQAWAHGPLDGRVDLTNEGSVRFEVAPLPARTFWEGRVLFPAEVVGDLPALREEAKPRINEQERVWAEAANHQREEILLDKQRRAALVEQLLPWTVLASVLGVCLWTCLYFLVGRAYPANRRFTPGEFPSDHPPAIVGYLLYRKVGSTALAATLIDLSRRGFIRIVEREREENGLFGKKTRLDYHLERTEKPLVGLFAYESNLVEFLLQAGDGRNGVWLHDFKKMARRKRARFARWFRGWQKGVIEIGKRENFFEKYSPGVIALNIGSGVLISALGLFASLVSASRVGVPALVVGLLQAALSLLLSRRTPEGRELQMAWIEFKGHLKSTSKARGPMSFEPNSLGRFLVASVLFGMHRDFARLLEISGNDGQTDHFAWYVAHGTHRGQGIGGLANGLSSMVASVGSAMSSTAGSGGGATGGGGGGSGGGGGGAG